MATFIRMTCGGCDAETQVKLPPRKFVSFTGKSYGLGVYHHPSVAEVVEPTGWIHSDPYTGCTYCPACWTKIENGEPDTEEKTE